MHKPQPRDNHGHFIKTDCDECGAGSLKDQGINPLSGRREWSCDGLKDPEHPNKDLEACPHTHTDGDPT